MSDWQEGLRLLHLLAAAVLVGLRLGGGRGFCRVGLTVR